MQVNVTEAPQGAGHLNPDTATLRCMAREPGRQRARRKVDVSSYTDAAVNRPTVQALMQNVTIVRYRDMLGRPNRAWGGESWMDVTQLSSTTASA